MSEDVELMLLSEVRTLQDEVRRKELARWNWEQSAGHARAEVERLKAALLESREAHREATRERDAHHREETILRAEVARLRAERDEARADCDMYIEAIQDMRPHAEGCNFRRRGDQVPCSCMTEVERLRAYVAKLESEPAPTEALAEVERLTKERDEAYDREAAAFDALIDEQIRAGKAGAEVERLRGLILSVERAPNAPDACPWCRCGGWHESDCPAFSARGEVRR